MYSYLDLQYLSLLNFYDSFGAVIFCHCTLTVLFFSIFFFLEGHYICIYPSMFVLLFPCPELSNDMAIWSSTPHHVFVDDQTLESYRSASVYSPCTDPNLRSETIPEAIRKASAGVDKRSRRIHGATEYGASFIVFRHDGVSMMWGVGVDELDSWLERWDGYDGKDKGKMLCLVGFGRWWFNKRLEFWRGRSERLKSREWWRIA